MSTTHRMHAEWGEVDRRGRPRDERDPRGPRAGAIIPVGTTALRLIETAAADGTPRPFRGETDIFIRPGYTFRATDALMTNFHLPKSTLMMLVSALMGVERMRQVYAHAIAENYRFFSYGDSIAPDPAALKTTRPGRFPDGRKSAARAGRPRMTEPPR